MGAVWEELQERRTLAAEICGQWSPMGGTHAGPREELLSLRRKAAAETTWDELTAVPIPCLLHHWRMEVENWK